jgi:hypothetical protein
MAAIHHERKSATGQQAIMRRATPLPRREPRARRISAESLTPNPGIRERYRPKVLVVAINIGAYREGIFSVADEPEQRPVSSASSPSIRSAIQTSGQRGSGKLI